MTILELSRTIRAIRPGAEWSLNGNDYNGLEWHDQIQSKPTLQEIEAAYSQLSYRQLRSVEYPSIGDQLDALWKGGDALDAMKTRIDAIKAQYPKP